MSWKPELEIAREIIVEINKYFLIDEATKLNENVGTKTPSEIITKAIQAERDNCDYNKGVADATNACQDEIDELRIKHEAEIDVSYSRYHEIGKLRSALRSIEDLPHKIDGVGELQIYRDENGWLVGYDEDCVKFAASGKTLQEAVTKLKPLIGDKG